MAGSAPSPVRSQEVVPPAAGAPNENPAGGADAADPAVPDPPTGGPAAPRPRVVMGPLDVIHESIFGAASTDDWQPLSLATFFSQGWDEPFARSPAGTNGAPKQNWFGAPDAVFARLFGFSFFYTNGMTTKSGLLLTPLPWSPAKPKTSGNEYFSTFNLYLPLNQRYEVLVVAPFIASNPTGPTGHYVANFGDLTISNRFRLIEQRNFTLQALLTERTPTGKTVNGNNINFVTPGLEAWWNFAPRWVLRGGTGINIDTGRRSATSVYFNNLALGRYLTTQDARVFKELCAHVGVATLSDVAGRKDYISDIYIQPGIRFGLDADRKWYAIGGVQVPVSGPHPYAWLANFGLVRNY